MANINIEICDLEAILTDHRDAHTEQELGVMEEDLARLRYIRDVWESFGDIPMNPETECIEQPFTIYHQFGGRIHHTFPAGTHREDVWHWMEDNWAISVGEYFFS